ncbi:cytochrome oxidase c subunit VIb domain-containing protein [Hirsutella rhossiliensis]|uniref:Cytochrome oxidase c subunit VIb domain-containing protein n=1 Tax=Hirsutella rhossiliensis TaxID=111463 RepID=A0A9P8N2A8_9HYPO|nr:cytochrome oxidase c subunit VIb domain-containing protein [Hirsutella rhossiliensis]KAH0964631.1 cytochrome oxidase c subunit VIb domain-containing protein [Hirsutella rhossiliensis]
MPSTEYLGPAQGGGDGARTCTWEAVGSQQRDLNQARTVIAGGRQLASAHRPGRSAVKSTRPVLCFDLASPLPLLPEPGQPSSSAHPSPLQPSIVKQPPNRDRLLQGADCTATPKWAGGSGGPFPPPPPPPPPPPRADAIRSGAAIPTRAERQQCWAARDAYFACLDAHDILDATRDPAAARRACPRESDVFERDCAAAWVTHFKQWRVADAQKRRRLDELRRQGAHEMTVQTSFAPEAASKPASSKDDIQNMLHRKRSA